MKPVRNVFFMNGIVMAFCSSVGWAWVFSWFYFPPMWDMGNRGRADDFGAAFYIFFAMAVIWTIGAAVCFSLALRERVKLQGLKKSGKQYDAKINEIECAGFFAWAILRFGIRFGTYPRPSRAICTYKTHDGKIHTVRSGIFSRWRNVNYSAVVYANPDSPLDYAVEILKEAEQ
ncbi:MAG: hypothetical protein FWF77_03310 [Defluviitaleaceae bacterium]|nr:hypothetical protein [Defluviitaleaceae bacterium]